MENNFDWFGKRVLITGGDGFVASQLTRALLQRGALVTVTVRHKRAVPTSQLLANLDGDTNLIPNIEECDLSSFSHVQSVCHRHQIDTIFHLAAAAIVRVAANAPMSTIENNVIGTLNLLEAARIIGIPRVIVASSDKSYGDHADADDVEHLPYQEAHALRGLDVYSVSKAAADMISQCYAFQYKLGVLVTRCCNIYGPGDLNFTRLIPRTVMKLLSSPPKAPGINVGNADVLREYIYIDDVVNAYIFLAEKLADYYTEGMPGRGKATYGWADFNVGSYRAPRDIDNRDRYPNIQSVRGVINLIQRQLGTDLAPEENPKPANFIEIPDQYLDSSKLLDLGFQPQVALEEGVARATEWYRGHFEYFSRLGKTDLD